MIARFEWSDAWVLAALAYAEKPADRGRIVCAGDYMNHAVMTSDELEGGLRRLCAAGYVAETNTTLDLTDLARPIMKGAGTRSVSQTVEAAERMLGVGPAR